MNQEPGRIWAVVPAAGRGTRMQNKVPKQYLPLAGRRVLDCTLDALLQTGAFSQIVVVLAPGDECWQHSPLAGDERIVIASGADQRCESVRNGLLGLRDRAADEDRVAVHDAARPCVTQQDMRSVLEAAQKNTDGALLALPVADTLKRAGADDQVAGTVDRKRLWRALTPQVFPYRRLLAALEDALSQGVSPTDEAQAMELAGARPLLVQGSAANVKITRPEDLQLAEALLRRGDDG